MAGYGYGGYPNYNGAGLHPDDSYKQSYASGPSTYNGNGGPYMENSNKPSYASGHSTYNGDGGPYKEHSNKPSYVPGYSKHNGAGVYTDEWGKPTNYHKTEVYTDEQNKPTNYHGTRLHSDDWRKPSYGSDHVSKPLVSYNGSPGEYSITETETLIERVHSPLVSGEHKKHSPTKFKPFHVENSKPSSPSAHHDLSGKVNDFLTKVQTAASRPKFSPSITTRWKQQMNPSSTGYQGEHHDDYYRKNYDTMEPTVITNGGWARPNQKLWSTPPDSSLSKPTNDIGEAMELLKEAATSHGKSSTPFPGKFTSGPKTDTYTDAITIDSREAARRYGNFKFPARQTEQSYTTTIDSREAARRYGGAIV